MKTLEMWLDEYLAELRTFSVHTAAEKRLLELASLPTRTSTQTKELRKIADAERTKQRGKKKAAHVNSMMRANRNKERAAANRYRKTNLIAAGELMVLAGLLSEETGLPHLDRATLVGACLGLAKLDPSHQKFADWKIKGQAKLDEVERKMADDASEPLQETDASDINEATTDIGAEDGFDSTINSQKDELAGLDGD